MKIIPHSKPFFGKPEAQRVEESLTSPIITDGIFKTRFSDGLKSFMGVSQFYFSNSGTESLFIILKALNIQPGDEVILPSYVCESVYYAILNAGAIPILVNVNEDWVTSPEEIAGKITNKTKAIVVVYTFGVICEIEKIISLGIPVIEDICQSLGLSINGKQAGSFGVASFISFKAIKCITTGGEGGGFFLNDESLVANVNKLNKNYWFSGKITELQAAFGTSQLEQYNSFLEERKQIARQYEELFVTSDKVTKTSYGLGMNYRFVVQSKLDVEDTMKRFLECGIHLRRGVDALLHKVFNHSGDFSVTESVFNKTISFPIYPGLTREDFLSISETIKKTF